MVSEREGSSNLYHDRKADRPVTKELASFYATIAPPEVDVKGSPYTWEIRDLRRASTDRPLTSPSLVISLPEEIGGRLVDFFQYYFVSQFETSKQPPYSCHTSTAIAKGWLRKDEYNPNLVGWGGADILISENTKYPFVDLSEIVPGNAYGIVTLEQPYHLLHSFIGLTDTSHIGVRHNQNNMVIANHHDVLDYYRTLKGQEVGFRLFDARPAVLDTANWEQRERDRYTNRPYKAPAKIWKTKNLMA